MARVRFSVVVRDTAGEFIAALAAVGHLSPDRNAALIEGDEIPLTEERVQIGGLSLPIAADCRGTEKILAEVAQRLKNIADELEQEAPA